jgi:hypothetical protein
MQVMYLSHVFKDIFFAYHQTLRLFLKVYMFRAVNHNPHHLLPYPPVTASDPGQHKSIFIHSLISLSRFVWP